MLITDATNLPRLMNCNGSRLMPAAFPSVDIDPTARDEGTAAHHMAQQALYGIDIASLINTKAPNGFVMTAEMADYVLIYLDAITDTFEPSRIGDIECDTSYGTDQFRVNGRADRVFYAPDIASLYVDDFKYGWHIVEPEMNWTLISHAIGWVIGSQQWRDQTTAPINTIVLRIHQPRPHHPDGKTRSWTITIAELWDLYARIAETMTNPTDMLVTGLGWCRTCHALANCPAARAARMNAVDATGMAFNDELPNEALAYELDVIRTAKATLDAQLDALEELTMHRLRGGAVIDNYALEPQYANTRWKPGISPEVLTLASGVDCLKPGVITPAEAKRRGMPESVVKTLTERPMIGTKLIRSTADQRARKLLQR